MEKQNIDYRKAGVDISEGNRAVDLIKGYAASTFNKNVLAPLGSFASMYDISWIKEEYKEPVLVQSVDGVGTKIVVSKLADDFSTIGEDLFNACTNDIAVHGAKPLTFLDYIANDKLSAERVATIVKGLAKACLESSVALVGGETAEMPGVYLPGEHDIVGLVTGIVEKEHIIDGRDVKEGDVILGVGSSGLHTNGYSLARKVLFDLAKLDVHQKLYTDESVTVGEALLKTHLNYSKGIQTLLDSKVRLKSISHITGGGLVENVKRTLPKNVDSHFNPETWPVNPIFRAIEELGNISKYEMYRTFNMGLGLTIVVSLSEAKEILKIAKQVFPAEVYEVGKITKGEGRTFIEGVTK